MATSDNLHSKLVVWAKVTLPLLALALLATLFLFSRKIDPTDAIPYADVDVEERAREPRLTMPTYAGVTSDGSALSISATEARPDKATGVGTAIAIVGKLDTPDGARIDLQAANGVLNTEEGLMTLNGGVTLTTTTGYVIKTKALIARLDQTGLSSPGAIMATTPMGKLDAGQMTLTQDPSKPDAYLLVFKGRVKVLYTPAKQ
jgi:lipopolysaccharide export system protein LptC